MVRGEEGEAGEKKQNGETFSSCSQRVGFFYLKVKTPSDQNWTSTSFVLFFNDLAGREKKKDG